MQPLQVFDNYLCEYSDTAAIECYVYCEVFEACMCTDTLDLTHAHVEGAML